MGTNWNADALASAAGKAMTAVSITDEQIIELCQQSVAQMDKENKVNKGAYDQRLRKLMLGITEVEGLKLNYKVYETSEVNAFACGDGSIRVYSGLMDVMNDDQLIAIIGHEIGHVVHQDTKNAMKRAYALSAASDLIGSAGAVGALTQATISGIAESFVSAQFSQKQEYAADDYGFEFSVAHGHPATSMASSLEKLVVLSEGAQASAVAQMFSSHPDSAKRAARMREKAAKYTK